MAGHGLDPVEQPGAGGLHHRLRGLDPVHRGWPPEHLQSPAARATGEETGAFVDSFGYLADFFSSSITEKTKKLPVVLEPTILIVIGLIVAFVASATILPIYEVTKGF